MITDSEELNEILYRAAARRSKEVFASLTRKELDEFVEIGKSMTSEDSFRFFKASCGLEFFIVKAGSTAFPIDADLFIDFVIWEKDKIAREDARAALKEKHP